MITKVRILLLIIVGFCLNIRANKQVTLRMNLGQNDIVHVELSTIGTIGNIKNIDIGAEQIKKIWFSDIRQSGVTFVYKSNQNYGADLGAIQDQNLRMKVTNAMASFGSHLDAVRKAFGNNTTYSASADVELQNNPYAAANRAMYNHVRTLGATVGMQLPNINWPVSKQYKMLLITVALAAGVGAAYWAFPSQSANLVEMCGLGIQSSGKGVGKVFEQTGSILGSGVQKLGKYMQPATAAIPQSAPPVSTPSQGWFSRIFGNSSIKNNAAISPEPTASGTAVGPVQSPSATTLGTPVVTPSVPTGTPVVLPQ